MPRAPYGNPRRRLFSADYFTKGVKWLIIINTVIFLATTLAPASIQEHIHPFALAPDAVIHYFAVWQLVTYLFLHGGPWHLIINMLVLWMFGVQLERDWGTRRFLKYYFVCGIGAGICDVVLN